MHSIFRSIIDHSDHDLQFFDTVYYKFSIFGTLTIRKENRTPSSDVILGFQDLS